jgi:pSer/pThr/pTyr-binding forkhead associated (FHA) protein
MKLTLVVMTAGSEGKAIPIKLPQFLIGRDPHCQLRPASPLISNRHCALLMRGGSAHVRDFESTNGTFVNDARVRGQKELTDGDELRIGPLVFKVRLEIEAGDRRATPPPRRADEGVDDEEAAALLLSLQDDPDPSAAGKGLDSEGVPTGSTVMDMPAVPAPDDNDEKKAAAKKTEIGDTSQAASTLLQKYLRRKKK